MLLEIVARCELGCRLPARTGLSKPKLALACEEAFSREMDSQLVPANCNQRSHSAELIVQSVVQMNSIFRSM